MSFSTDQALATHKLDCVVHAFNIFKKFFERISSDMSLTCCTKTVHKLLSSRGFKEGEAFLPTRCILKEVKILYKMHHFCTKL